MATGQSLRGDDNDTFAELSCWRRRRGGALFAHRTRLARRAAPRVTGGARQDWSMRIISNSQARQILKNDLKRRAVERQAAQLQSADPEERQALMAKIDHDVEKEMRSRRWGHLGSPSEGSSLIH